MLVLLVGIVPTAILPGIAGQSYREFGVTLSAATLLSSVNARALVFVNLLRAAQYKSGAIPVTIMPTIPIDIVSALAATMLRTMASNV